MSICAACSLSANRPDWRRQSVEIPFKLDYSLQWHKLMEKTNDDFQEATIGLSIIDGLLALLEASST